MEKSKEHKKENKCATNLGWTCPVCGRGMSPYQTTCPCVEPKPERITEVGG